MCWENAHLIFPKHTRPEREMLNCQKIRQVMCTVYIPSLNPILSTSTRQSVWPSVTISIRLAVGRQVPKTSDCPWVLAACISGMSHITTIGRMSIRKSWKEEARSMKHRGIDDSFSLILVDERVVARYNMGCTDQADHILFVSMIERKSSTDEDT